jgi:hypothetical protein
MSDDPIVEDDQPEPEEELRPALSEEGERDPVTDDAMGEPTGLPDRSLEADPNDIHGKDDHPQENQGP